MSKVSVVMVSYHTGPSLWLAIDSVLAQPECSELILVNNGNTPGVEKLLVQRARQEKRLTLITGNGNVGFAKGCNMGAKRASGEYILLLNPDCMLPEGGLARALEAIAPYPNNTLAGCYLANPSGSEQRGGRRGIMTPYNSVFETLGVSFLLPKDQRLNQNSGKMPLGAHEVPAISGAFMFLARSYWEKLKGMDEDYFLHMEDMDFCYRVNKAGGKIIMLPEVRVIHFRSTSEVSGKVVEKHKAKSFILYLRKHFTDEASRFLTLMMSGGIWLRYYLKCFVGAVNKIFEPPLLAKQKVARLVILHHITKFGKRPQTLAGKRLLVTGAGGQLGLCVTAECLARGANVIAITHHAPPNFKHEELTWVERDLLEKGNPLEGAEVDIVIHTAEITMFAQNLDYLCDNGAKRVIAFSCIPVLEKSASRYKADRQRAKLFEAEEKELFDIAAEKGCAITILRPSQLYGVGLDKGLTRQADAVNRFGRLPIYGAGKGLRQPVHVQDVAAAAMAVVGNENTFGKTYAIGGANALPYREMLEQLFAYQGKKPRFFGLGMMPGLLSFISRVYSLKHINGDVAYAMNRSVTIDNTLPAQDFGYNPRAFLEGDVGF